MTSGPGGGVALQVLPVGDEGLLLEVATLDDVLAVDAALRVAVEAGGPAWRDVTDVVPAARTVLLLTRENTDLAALARAVRQLAAAGSPHGPGDLVRPTHGSARAAGPQTAGTSNEVEIAVRYDGPDLDDVARLTGLSRAEVVAAHTGMPWRVAFGGFAPGFAYLVGGDPRLVVPRRDHPRPTVPGRLAAAGHDGSRPLGRAPGPAGTAHPGDVRALRRRHGRAVSPALEVLATGPLCLVEDEGRPGLAALGVGRSGAADRGAHRLGARLVGHPPDRAALEVLLGGLAVRARGRVTVALTGAHAPATVDGREVAHAALVEVPHGAVLALGMPSAGLRTYLTVRGGIDVAPVLGSRSTDTLSGLGPPPVRIGDVLHVGDPGTAFPRVDHAARPAGSPGQLDRLELLPGPRAAWVGGWGTDLGGLLSASWRVSDHSDRVGLRLTGWTVSRAAAHDGSELPSEGVVRGAVQVPPGGEPVVFLADHPVTGGYPVVAVLTASAADRAAQLRPGDVVRLVREPAGR